MKLLALIKKNKIKYTIFTILLLLASFIILHSTTSLSIKTYLFFHGHIGVFSIDNITYSDIETTAAIDNNSINKTDKIYIIKNSKIEDWRTWNIISAFKVKKYKFLYFSDKFMCEV